MKLRKLEPTEFGLSRYLHPHGYVIERCRRTWSERNGNQVGGGCALYWWEVREHVSRTGDLSRFRPEAVKDGRPAEETDTLAEAREWCDEHPRDGWLELAGSA